MAKKRITDVPRNGSDADFVPENYMLIDGAEGSAKMRMNLFGKASTIEELDEVKYEKPEGGIPKIDLDPSVQTSLGKADSALQQHQSLDGYVNGITTDSTTTFGDSSTIVAGKSGKNLLTRTASALWTYIKGKADSVYASLGHTHSVKINGTTKTIAASGGTAVDLGTYLTSHQDISGKANTDGSNASGTWPVGISGNAATATNSTYTSKIGSSSSHPGIGSTSQPVFVDTDGIVKPCDNLPKVHKYHADHTITQTEITNKHIEITINFNEQVKVKDIYEWEIRMSVSSTLALYAMSRIEVYADEARIRRFNRGVDEPDGIGVSQSNLITYNGIKMVSYASGEAHISSFTLIIDIGYNDTLQRLILEAGDYIDTDVLIKGSLQ